MSARSIYSAVEKELKGAKNVTVVFPDSTETFKIGKELNISEGKLDISSATSNIVLWRARGYEVKITK